MQNLDRNIFIPTIITLSREPEISRKSDFEGLNVKIYSLNLSRLMWVFLALKRVRKLLSQINPDIIHSNGIRSDYLSKNYITVSTLHNNPFEDYLMRYGYLRGIIMAQAHMRILRRIHNPVTVSRSVSRNLKSEKRLELSQILNGVDENKFKRVDDANRLYLREALDLPKDKTILISVGHLSSLKNPKFIIEAFQKLESANDLLLIFLGTGKLKKTCEEMTKGDERINLMGKVDNVYQYLQASDCFISSSRSEGMPNSVLEAMGCGLPVLLSGIPQHIEIFEDYECPFPFFDITRIEDLKVILQNLTIEKLNESRDFYRRVFIENYTASIMSTKYQNLYKEVLKQDELI